MPYLCILEAYLSKSDCLLGLLKIQSQALSVPQRVQQKQFTSFFGLHTEQEDLNITAKENLDHKFTTDVQFCIGEGKTQK